ncbi:MAG: fructose-1,6-bisphosphatase [Tissierellales bacterium]|jgi:fructose-1,6-bisphosphatase-3|nr:fructose-1,6-bisphosphatase [Tissierellales bacterium]
MKKYCVEELEEHLKYLKLLSNQFPTISEVSSEIINLQAILNLPKGTEHFITDVHGEYESFTHVMRNASGVLKIKIDDIFGNTVRSSEKKNLATLIYYPEKKLELVKKREKHISDWYRIMLYRLIEVCRATSSKYTRSKVRKALPDDFAYIIEELLHEQEKIYNKHDYYNEIIHTIIEIDRADEFIIALCKLIQRFAIDRLHLIGDIYDRGPGAHLIMDELYDYHSLDIQWGNHDILWMGAAGGSKACIANVIRIATRYANLETIENGYGINLLPLATFALEYYGDDKCDVFREKFPEKCDFGNRDLEVIAKMHKAIAVIQFKLEGQIIKKSPSYAMESRLLLDKIDYEKGTIGIKGKTYDLIDKNFPTIDPKEPYKLSEEEDKLVKKLVNSFVHSEKLERHVAFMYTKGSLYLKYNSNLLFHGCVPSSDDGEFELLQIGRDTYKGRNLFDKFDRMARSFYFDGKNEFGADVMWYLWSGPKSPLFGKDQMTTFERYFIKDKATHKENKDPFYKYRDDKNYCNKILEAFGLDAEKSHIINGHVPVKTKNGESPIKADGKLLVIDGGFAKAYHETTGIAGYTLIYNSYGLRLASHEPFESTEAAILKEKDILSTIIVLEKTNNRKKVEDTDTGVALLSQIESLERLLSAYRLGLIKENNLGKAIKKIRLE